MYTESNVVRQARFACRATILFGACCLAAAPVMAQSPEGPAQRVLIRWKSDAGAAQAASAASTVANIGARAGVGMTWMRRIVTGSDVVRLDRKLSAAELENVIATLRQDPAVASIEEDLRVQPMLTPNDPEFNSQWHYYDPTGGMRLPGTWDLSTGTGVTVAVIDSGYVTHPDLEPNILPGYDFISDTFIANDGGGRDADPADPGDARTAGQCPPPFQDASDSTWHGTHIAGTIAAVGNNGVGVTGVAFNSRVVPIRALGRCGGNASDVIEAIAWAAGLPVNGVPINPNPAKVINLSLGVPSPTCPQQAQAVIDLVRARGTVVVAAAGNESGDATSFTPANCLGVIAVAATTRAAGKAPYSNSGTIVDVAAPGGDLSAGPANGVLSTSNAGRTGPTAASYDYKQGTSMAAAHVSGVAALMMSRNRDLQPVEVESTLKSTARAFAVSGCSLCGAGKVNAQSATHFGTALQRNGAAILGLPAPTGEDWRFTMTVPAGANVYFSITNGTGDADLYVRAGGAPTLDSYDCRPLRRGNDESCDFAPRVTTIYHVMVRARSAYDGVTFVAGY